MLVEQPVDPFQQSLQAAIKAARQRLRELPGVRSVSWDATNGRFRLVKDVPGAKPVYVPVAKFKQTLKSKERDQERLCNLTDALQDAVHSAPGKLL